MTRLLISMLLCTFCVFAPAVRADTEADHEALRAVINGIEEAINAGHYADLAPFFDPRMRVTTINQEVLSSPGEIAGYFDSWFGEGGYLDRLHMELTADAPTEFYADGTLGIVRGSGKEDYILADGRSFDMVTRWTATVIKGEDGQWRILALHIGTDFLDNPILAVAEGALLQAVLAGLAAGVLITLLLVAIFGRRKRARA